MYQRKIFSNLLMTTALVLSFSGQLHAMEPENDDRGQWSIRVNLPSISVISEEERSFTVSIPYMTGLDGEINVPILYIENFPEMEVENLQKYLNITTDELHINGRRTSAKPFNPRKQANDDKGSWGIWGNFASVTQENKIFTLSIPNTTGIEGEINVPGLHIENLPKKDIENIKKILNIRTDELRINGERIYWSALYNDENPHDYVLSLSGNIKTTSTDEKTHSVSNSTSNWETSSIPMEESAPSIQNPVSSPCRDLFKHIPVTDHPRYFEDIFKQLRAQLNLLPPYLYGYGEDLRTNLQSPITCRLGGRHLNLSRISCTFDRAGDQNKSYIYDPNKAYSFQADLGSFLYFADTIIKTPNLCRVDGKTSLLERKNIWASNKWKNGEYVKYTYNRNMECIAHKCSDDKSRDGLDRNFYDMINQFVLSHEIKTEDTPVNSVLAFEICPLKSLADGKYSKENYLSLELFSDDK